MSPTVSPAVRRPRAVLSVAFLAVALALVPTPALAYIGPGAGISFMGIAINLNTFISFLLIFLAFIVFFGIFMIPSFRLYNYFRENTLSGTVSFFSSIIKKGIQYILVIFPSALFSSILLIIPAILLVASFWLTNTLKDEVLDFRLNQLRMQQSEVTNELQAYELQQNIIQIQFLKDIPGNLLKEMFNRNNLDYEISTIGDNIRKEEEKLFSLREKAQSQLQALDNQISSLSGSTNADGLTSLKEQKLLIDRAYSNQSATIVLGINKYRIDQKYLHRKSKQIPVIFFLSGIWISLFGGLVLSFLIAYLGNVFYELYLFRNDGTPSYFNTIILQEKEKDNKQPLLGFSLLIILIILIYLFYRFKFPFILPGI